MFIEKRGQELGENITQAVDRRDILIDSELLDENTHVHVGEDHGVQVPHQDQLQGSSWQFCLWICFLEESSYHIQDSVGVLELVLHLVDPHKEGEHQGQSEDGAQDHHVGGTVKYF